MSKYFPENPAVCAARAADPAWQAEQQRKSEAASQRFAVRRAMIGHPLIQKKAGERF